MAKTNFNYTCEFCGKNFVRESAYAKHRCEAMERHENMRTLVGQAALMYYKTWFRFKKRRLRNDMGFLKSQYYKPFMKFAEFARKVHLPEPDTFIKRMVDKNYAPAVWHYSQVYTEYLEFLDQKGDPYSRAADSIKTIRNFAEDADIPFEAFFEKVTTPEMVHMIYSRRLSPWVLLHSPKFKAYLQKVSPSDRTLIQGVIRPAFWAKRFKGHPEACNYMNSIVRRLKL